MDIISLKYFIRVCENKNLTNSANELFMTQQALSRIIRKLEKELGSPLFERNSRGVELTELGEYLYPKACTLISQFYKFEEDIEQKVKMNREKIKVGFAPGTLRTLGTRELVEFCSDELGIDIIINEYRDIECESHVLNGKLDLACTVNPRQNDKLAYYHLTADHLIAVVNKDNPLSKKDKINFSDLRNEKLILLDETFRLQSVINEQFAEAGFEPNIYTKCRFDLMITYDFVSLNRGTFIFVDSLTDVSNYPNLCIVPIEGKNNLWNVGFIVKKDKRLSHTMKKFMNYFLEKNHQEIF